VTETDKIYAEAQLHNKEMTLQFNKDVAVSKWPEKENTAEKVVQNSSF
jgi:hypothetical protein